MNGPTATAQPAGNFYDKYNTRNPVARALMRGFLSDFEALLGKVSGTSALEIGCGEAELSIRIAQRGWQVQGCDIAPEVIAEAERRIAQAGLSIPVAVCDIAQAAHRFKPVDLVVCCEVLEHLEDPEAGLDTLASLSRGHVLLSVPREPLWRVLNVARGKYLGDWGNTPGHVQHWSASSFRHFVSRRFEVREVRSPLPWTMILGHAR